MNLVGEPLRIGQWEHLPGGRRLVAALGLSREPQECPSEEAGRWEPAAWTRVHANAVEGPAEKPAGTDRSGCLEQRGQLRSRLNSRPQEEVKVHGVLSGQAAGAVE